MAVRMKQTLEQDVIGFRKRPLELRKPVVRNGRGGFCFHQHSRTQAIDLRGVSRLYNLHHLSRAERGVMDGTPAYRSTMPFIACSFARVSLRGGGARRPAPAGERPACRRAGSPSPAASRQAGAVPRCDRARLPPSTAPARDLATPGRTSPRRPPDVRPWAHPGCDPQRTGYGASDPSSPATRPCCSVPLSHDSEARRKFPASQPHAAPRRAIPLCGSPRSAGWRGIPGWTATGAGERRTRDPTQRAARLRAASSPPCRSCLIPECPAVYHVFSFRFHKSKPIDLIKNPNLAAVYINELMAIQLLLDCATHHLNFRA